LSHALFFTFEVSSRRLGTQLFSRKSVSQGLVSSCFNLLLAGVRYCQGVEPLLPRAFVVQHAFAILAVSVRGQPLPCS